MIQIGIVGCGRIMAAHLRGYRLLREAGVDVLMDDRDARAGVMFADCELIGIPHRVVIGDRGLANGLYEYRHRRDTESRDVKREEVLELIKEPAVS